MNTLKQYLHKDVNTQSDTTVLWNGDDFDEIYFWYR